MDIVSQNFREQLPLMLQSIETADFIALDTEFSGLAVNNEDQVHAFDQVEDRYQKLSHTVKRMYAFQIGFCCFKFDHKKGAYVCRPFNVFVFPHSEVQGNRTMQFKASNVRFLMKHHFDFNKLFKEGVNFQRLCEAQQVKQKIQTQIDMSGRSIKTDSQSMLSFGYSQQRTFTSIGSRSTKCLDEYIRKVQNFVLLCKKTDDLPVLEFKIESYALRRRLSQVLQQIYRDRLVIFTSFQRYDDNFIVRKWRDKSENFEESQNSGNIQQEKPKELKVSENDCEDSDYDKIIKNVDNGRQGITILHEDDICMAFMEPFTPIAKCHIVVVAKDSDLCMATASADVLGQLTLVASKVANSVQELKESGFRIVSDVAGLNTKNGKIVYLERNNLTMHIIGGQQLSWPPFPVQEETEESKTQKDEQSTQANSQQEEEKKEDPYPVLSGSEAVEELYQHEMGFALVMDALIKSKKPFIGHNCLYDWLYIYNQFVAPLPENYSEFINDWNAKFPNTFDNKVLAFNSKMFYKTGLGDLYEKCTKEDKFKNNLKFTFDLKNGFGNYDGTELLSHYHEAAYDAYMTGVVFANCIKFKEIDEAKQIVVQVAKANQQRVKPVELKDAIASQRNQPISVQSTFPNSLVNHMMLDSFGSGRVYHFNPASHQAYLKDLEQKPEFPETVYLEFKPGFLVNKSAEQVSKIFSGFGDFYIYKNADNQNSVWLEFFYVDPEQVPDRKLESFISNVVNLPELGVVRACMHKDAPRFKSHNILDFQ